jgi:hypothetical protein
MGDITILDTGFLKTDNSGTRLGTSDMANSGSPLTLYGVEVKFQRSASLDTNPDLATYADTDINFIGFKIAGLSIKGTINPSVSAQRESVRHMEKLVRTKGWKALYFDYGSSNADRVQHIVYQLAQTIGKTFSTADRTAFGLSDVYSYLAVRVKDFEVTEVGDNGFWRFSMTLVLTKAETSVL